MEFLLLIDLDTDCDLTILHQEMEVNGEKLSLRSRNGQSWATELRAHQILEFRSFRWNGRELTRKFSNEAI
jgi:hypothetical protein